MLWLEIILRCIIEVYLWIANSFILWCTIGVYHWIPNTPPLLRCICELGYIIEYQTLHHYWGVLANWGTSLAHVAEMSVFNHELSIVWHHCHWHCPWMLLPATGLITETSHLSQICTYAPSICTWISEYNMYFLNGSHFSQFLYVALLTASLSLELSYLAQLWTYTGATLIQEIMQLWTEFLKW